MAASKEPKQRLRYRRLPLAEKRRIVELALREGASMSAIARQYGVNRHSLYQWQALYRAGKLDCEQLSAPRAAASSPAFLPVTIATAVRPSRSARHLRADGGVMNVVELTILSGAVLRIETSALSTELIRALIAELRR
ncbi:MAG: transposase [Candidatus Cybelea sp.]